MNGRIYSITEEQVERFLTDYPDATEVLDPNEKNLASNKITSPGIEHKNVTPKSTGNTENLTWGQTKILEKDRRKKLKEEEEREAIGANYDVNLELQKADKLFKDVLEMNTDVDLITKLNNLETQKSTSKDLVFFNLDTKIPQATEEAIMQYQKKYQIPGGDITTLKQADEYSVELLNKAVQNDPQLTRNYRLRFDAEESNINNYKATIEEEIKNTPGLTLAEKTQLGQDKLDEFIKENITNPFTETVFFKSRVNQIGVVVDAVVKDKTKESLRSQDKFFGSVLDNDFTQSIYASSEQMKTGFKQSELSKFHGSIENIDKEIERLSGLDPNVMAIEKAGDRKYRGTNSERIKFLNKEKIDIQEKIKRKVKEVEKLQFENIRFNKADFDDGIEFSDIVRTVGEAIPQLGAVAGGALLKSPALSSVGLLSIFGQEYGSNYYDAVKQGLVNDKIEPTEENINKAIEEGKYANRGMAALAAGIQTGLERYGAVNLVTRFSKGLGFGNTKKLVTSIFDIKQGRNEAFKNIIKSSGTSARRAGEGGLIESGTELGQSLISQLVKSAQLGDPALKYLDLKELRDSAIAGGIVGTVIPGGASVMSQSATEIRNMAREVATEFDMRGSGFVQANTYFKEAKKRINNEYDITNMTESERNIRLENLANMRNAGLKIPSNFSVDSKKKIFDLMMERNQLEQQINITDPALSVEEIARVAEINQEITKIGALEKLTRNVIEGSTKQGFGKNIFEMKTTEEAQAKAKELGIEMKGEGAISMDAENIILDMERAAEVGSFNVAGHEVLHRILFKTLYDIDQGGNVVGKDVVRSLTLELKKELDRIKPQVSGLKDSNLKTRLERFYADEGKTIKAEEYLTLFTDALVSEQIVIEETFGEKIGGIIRRMFQNLGFTKIKFNDGKDVLNFLKDYSVAVKTGNFGKAIGEIAREGAEVTTKKGSIIKLKDDISDETSKQSREEASNRVQQIYAEKGVDGSFEIIEEYRPMASKLAARFRDVPGYDVNKDILVDEILTGKRGVIDLIKEYKPDQGVPLAAYINKFLRSRSIEVGNRILDTTFKSDVTEARDVVATETAEDVVIEEEIRTKTKATKPTLRQRLKIKKDDDDYNKILDAANKVLSGKLLPVDSYEFRNAIQKDLFTLLKPTLANVMGTRSEYTKFLKDYRKDIINQLDVKDLVAIERNEKNKIFTEIVEENVPPKKLREYERSEEYDVTYKSETSGPTVYRKKTPSEKEFLEFYDIKGSKKGTRKDKLAELIGASLGFDAVPQLLQDEALVDRIKEIYKQRDITPPKDIKAEIITAVKREPGGKLSISEKDDIQSVIDASNIFQEGEVVSVPTDMRSISAQEDWSGWNNIVLAAKIKDDVIGNGIFDMTKPEDRAVYRDWIKNVGSKILPKQFWFDNSTLTGAGKSSYNNQYAFNNKKEMNEFFKGIDFVQLSKKDTKLIDAMTKKVGITSGVGDNRILQKKFIKEFGTDKFKKLQNDSIKGLELVFKKFANVISEDKNNIAFVAQLLKSTSRQQGHFIRVAAPVRFYEKNIVGAITEEHSLPASLTAKYLLNSAIQNNVTKAFKPIETNYFQGPISKASDNKLKGKGVNNKGFNYISSMPPGWVLGKDLTWARYFNVNVSLQEGGINPDNIILENKKSVSDNYGVNSSGFIAKGNTIKTIKQAKTKNSQSNDFINPKDQTSKQISIFKNYDDAASLARNINTPEKGMSVFDFDDTIAKTKSKVLYTLPNGTKGKLSPTEFARKSAILEEKGAAFDFSEFNKVIKGKKGPLADLALKRQGKFGGKDIFILTARPQQSAPAIYEFLKGIGLDIPLKNITGLEDGTPAAKANWVAEKAAQGYNNIYFADDAMKNVKAVKAVLDVIDVKSKVQQAKGSISEKLDEEFNIIIEKKTGLGRNKEYSPARAKTVGASKGKFNFFIPYSAEDFVGLMYPLLSKGKEGDAQMAWFKKNLLDPFNRAESAITKARVSVAADFKALKAQFKTIPTTLKKEAVDGFTYETALRVYIWNQQGYEIPGLAKKDIKELTSFIEKDNDLKMFANELMVIQKTKPYNPPTENWLSGTITTDVIGGINTTNRAEYLQEWQQNVDIIFSPKNITKLEAAYGSAYVSALKNILRRMKTGSNKSNTDSKIVNDVLNWVNSSVGAIMFLNTRSAVLQTISSINFINWSDNNIYNAGKAFANQPQYWKDFMTLFNSDFLVTRRKGLKINVTESEIADAAEQGSVQGVISMLLKKGFVFTQLADSFAIASGGSSFYRNRINTYEKQGMSIDKAEEQAFLDFYEVAEESQQSSRTDRISAQQASNAGRVILAFGNTPMQYARLIKKASMDLANGRGDWKTNISKIIYYSTIQNIMFNALQNALFTMLFDDDDDIPQEKVIRIGNGMMDSLLRGLGIGGAALSTAKNIVLKVIQESGKKSPKYEDAALEILDLSPPISSKVSKLRSAGRTFSWNAKEIKEKGFSLDNPAYLAGAQVLSAGANIPLDRLIKKGNNIADAVSDESEYWQKIALLGGWSMWELEGNKKSTRSRSKGFTVSPTPSSQTLSKQKSKTSTTRKRTYRKKN
jgi:hypothetical protein